MIVAVMLLTDTFRSNFAVSRWRDAVWLASLAAPLYWIRHWKSRSAVAGLRLQSPGHGTQEHRLSAVLECPLPMVFYRVVNIALMWFGAPLAAFCKQNLVLGFSYWRLIFTNGLVHTMAGVTQHHNPGLWTASILFVPLSYGSCSFWCLAAHTAARLSPCYSAAEPSPMHCFSWATGSQGRGGKA